MKARRLGEPLSAVGVSAAGFGTYNGKPYIYAVGSGKTCAMYVIDAEDGVCLKKMDLNGSSHTWGVSVAKDGTVYAGGDGYFYRYIPGSDEAENLGKPIEGETYFWNTTIDDQDRPYCGTYPNGKIFRFDPKSQSFENYGQMVEGEQYVRSIVWVKGKIYAGIGSHAHLIELDPETGAKREIPLPDGCEDAPFVYDLSAAYPKLFAFIKNVLHIYDLEENRWVGKLENAGSAVSPLDEQGNVYLAKDGVLCALHVETMEIKPTEVPCQGVRIWGMVELSADGFPGKTLISANASGYWLYNPITKQYKKTEVKLPGIPVGIQSLTTGKDGTIYIGGYFNGGFASYDPDKDAFTECKAFGQSENLIEYKGKLYAGVYPKARIYVYDKTKEWKMNENPKLAFTLENEGQDRPFGLADAGRYLAIGTVPNYGMLGGALTLYDAERDVHEVFRQLVWNQSIICLTYHNGIIYGGTSVYGGLGVKPTESEGKLFLFDINEKRKVWEGVPVPGQKAVSALCVGENGIIWGLTPGYLFRFEPSSRTFEHVEQLTDAPDWEKATHFWRGEFIQYDPSGYLVGNVRGKLFRYRLADGKTEFLEERIGLFARDLHGNAYFARGTELFQYRFD